MRNRIQRRVVPSALLCLLMFSCGGGKEPGENAPPQPPPAETLADRVVYLTNLVRRDAGVPPLRGQVNLATAAQLHARDMGVNNYFDHNSQDGRTPWQRIAAAGYSGGRLAENIAAGQATAESVVQGWKESPGHNANMINGDFRELGVGYHHQPGSDFGHHWVQNFGTRDEVFPVVIEHEAFSTANPTVNLYIYGAGWGSEMMLSEDPAFAGAHWQPFTATQSFILSTRPGLKQIHVRLKHANGQVKTASDQIVLL